MQPQQRSYRVCQLTEDRPEPATRPGPRLDMAAKYLPTALKRHAMKLSKNLDEICYPFICETSYLCDFEVTTDELCSLIGAARWRQRLLSSQICAQTLIAFSRWPFISTARFAESWQLKRLICSGCWSWLDAYRNLAGERFYAFVLPRGGCACAAVASVPLAAKIRCMVRVEQEGREIPICCRVSTMCLQSVFCDDAGGQPAPWRGGAAVISRVTRYATRVSRAQSACRWP